MPRIKTTPMVRIALWGLRIYLLLLITLIGVKFARMYHQSKSAGAAPQEAVQPSSGDAKHP
jgi:hypothetical protein